jgi:outer membrane receptor protein involved in Fe transport
MIGLTLLSLAMTFASGDTLSGRVIDQNGTAVAGASVSLFDLHRIAVTGPDGVFRIVGVPAGEHTLIVRRLGFAPRVLQVGDSGATVVTLVSSPLPMEPVTVTATRSAINPLSSPLPAVAVSDDQLRMQQKVSLAHVLDGLPGVRTLSTGGEIGKPVIRGLTGSRVLVLGNGARVEDYSWSDEDGPSIDARTAQRVEVIRGPASVIYGTDAVGGVVNVMSAEIPDANGGHGFTRSGIEFYSATNNHEFGSTLQFEGARGKLGWRLLGTARTAEALHTPDAELDNTGFGSVNGEAAIGVKGEKGQTSIRYSRYGGEFKLLEANGPPPGTTEEADQGPERKLSDDRVQLSSDRILGSWRLEAKGQWQRHSLIEVSDDAAAPGAPKQEGTAFDLLLNTGSLDLLLHHGTRATHGTFGISGMAQTNDTRGPIPLVPDANLQTAGAFFLEQRDFGRWTVLAGGRVDVRHLSADPNATLMLGAETRDYTPWSGDLGVVFRPVTGLAVSFNAGTAWRAPTLFELFSNGPHLGEARYEIGDPGLVPERGKNLDLGVRWSSPRLRWDVSSYLNRMDHYIYITPTALFADSLRIYRYTQAKASMAGVEASFEGEPVRLLTLHGSVDAVRGTNEQADEPLPLIPPARVIVGGDFHPDLHGQQTAYVGMQVEYNSRQNRLNPLDIPTAAYTLLGFDAGWARPWGRRSLKIDIAVRNATAVRYRSFLSRYKEFALNPGRDVVFRVSLIP